MTEKLKRLIRSVFSTKSHANHTQSSSTIYQKLNYDECRTLDEAFDELQATEDEIYTIKRRMAKQNVAESSISSPMRYISKCLSKLRSGTQRLLKPNEGHNPHKPKQRDDNCPWLEAERHLDSMFLRHMCGLPTR